jgi:hypothetical protein
MKLGKKCFFFGLEEEGRRVGEKEMGWRGTERGFNGQRLDPSSKTRV